MKNIYFILLFLVLFTSAFSQKHTISGYISEGSTGEKLIGANIYEVNTLSGTVSNNYGFYSLTLPKGTVHIRYSFVGFEPVDKTFTLLKDTLINIAIDQSLRLEEVKIVGRSGSNVENTQMSEVSIPIQTIKALPAFLGETDIIKTIQLLPGVQSGSEGMSGLYVRGGGPDQNLILLDGVPVYNVNHLFGFFSVFNPDAVNSVKLVKGGFPARYGGRLSSVLDIRMKEGNTKELKGEGAIGLISSKLTLEGPIKNENTSFIISARRTYIDILTQPLIRNIEKKEAYDKFRVGYYFYDLNAKINHTFSNKDRLYLSAYMGNDKAYYKEKYSEQGTDYSFSYDDEFKLRWGNITTALRWNHIFNSKLFSNTTITYSRYKFITGIKDFTGDNESSEDFQFEYNSGINDLAGKIDFDFIPNPDHYIRFGVNHISHTFNPGVSAFKLSENLEGSTRIDTTFGNKKIITQEFAAYIEDDWNINPWLKINAGLHYSSFFVRNTSYYSFQPRISARFLVHDGFSLKAAYTKMTQYIHLLSNSNVGLPTDLWLPVTNTIKPQKADQYALGAFYRLTNNLQLSMEGFYKQMDKLLEYKEGASFLSLNDDWEYKVEPGKGESYGMEVLLEKKLGKTTGWIGYTLSWSNREFENINEGRTFAYKYDRRHDISFVLTHQLSDRVDMGITWVFGTGNAFTIATEKYPSLVNGDMSYYYQRDLIEYINQRNGFRMPSYHRLDVGFNFRKPKKWGERIWSIGVYNAYNRQNPFFLYYGDDYNTETNERETILRQVSLFPVIPSISYRFKF